MEIKNFFAQDSQGNTMPSADCYLYLPNTTSLAAGLVDADGLPISNPFKASLIGQVQFGAPNGVYDLRIAKGARDTTIRIQCADLLQSINEIGAFLGPHATAPTTRNDGSPLQLADRYLNTTDQNEYIYKASGWVDNNAALVANTVTLNTAQNITAKKTFTVSPAVPTPASTSNDTTAQSTAGSMSQIQSFGLGTPGAQFPDYLITPGNNVNTSPTRFIVALGSEDQAIAQQPEGGTAFSGIHIARGLRPSQMGVSGVGNNAKLFFRGYTAPTAALADWRQAASSSDQSFSGPIRPGQYSLTTLPNASSFSGYEIDVTNATGGPKRCRSNGTVWQILNTTTTVS